MDQVKIGKFIAERRKTKNLTQQELASELGITYKAVSKWECGNGLPDVSLYVPLCEILGITLNDFFAGECLKKEEVIPNSEKVILNLVKEESKQKKKLKKTIIILLSIIFVLILFLFIAYQYVHNYASVSRSFEKNWNIILPNDFKEEYHTNTGISFHGDGKRYSVFEGTNFLTKLNEEKNEELESEILELYTTLNIPKDKQIDFSTNYRWIKIYDKDDTRNYMYCIYDKNINKFYFYEVLL